jgi:hypothetical protein
MVWAAGAQTQFAVLAPLLTRSKFSSMKFYGGAVGGLKLGGWINAVVDCEFGDNRGIAALVIEGQANAIDVVRCSFEGNRGAGILVNGGTNVRIESNTIEGNGGPGVVANGVQALSMRSNYFEANLQHAINTTTGHSVSPAASMWPISGALASDVKQYNELAICADIVINGANTSTFTLAAPELSDVQPCWGVVLSGNSHCVDAVRCVKQNRNLSATVVAGVLLASAEGVVMQANTAGGCQEHYPTQQCVAVVGGNRSGVSLDMNVGWTSEFSGWELLGSHKQPTLKTDDGQSRTMNQLKGLPALLKPHLASNHGITAKDLENPGLMALWGEFARIAHSLPMCLMPWGPDELTMRTVIALASQHNASISVQYSPWYSPHIQPGCKVICAHCGPLPPDICDLRVTTNDTIELDFLRGRLANLTKLTAAANGPNSVKVSAAFLDVERFAYNHSSSTEWKVALTRKQDLIHDVIKSLAPDARIAQYGRGAVHRIVPDSIGIPNLQPDYAITAGGWMERPGRCWLLPVGVQGRRLHSLDVSDGSACSDASGFQSNSSKCNFSRDGGSNPDTLSWMRGRASVRRPQGRPHPITTTASIIPGCGAQSLTIQFTEPTCSVSLRTIM